MADGHIWLQYGCAHDLLAGKVYSTFSLNFMHVCSIQMQTSIQESTNDLFYMPKRVLYLIYLLQKHLFKFVK